MAFVAPFFELLVMQHGPGGKRHDQNTDDAFHRSGLPRYDVGARFATFKTKATITTQASEIGRNTFQPRRISWS